MRRLVAATSCIALACGGIGLLSSVARAAPPSVVVACGDTAGLVAAINGANQGGPSTIVLSSSCTYTLSGPAESDNGLPIVTSSMTLNGSGSTITRSAAAPQFRIIEVGSKGALNASDVTFRGGHAPDGADGANGPDGADATSPGSSPEPGEDGVAGTSGADGGAILVDAGGSLTLSSVTVTNNTAGRGGNGGAGGEGGDGSSGGPPVAGGAGGNGNLGGNGGDGGGIANNGSVTLTDVAVTGNNAGDGGNGGDGGDGGSGGSGPPKDGGNAGNGSDAGDAGNGGGIFNASGARLITRPGTGAASTTVTGNNAGDGGNGGDGGAGGDSSGSGPSVGGNGGDGGDGGAAGNGGGIFNSGLTSLVRTTVSGNSADGAGGAAGTAGSGGTGGPGGSSGANGTPGAAGSAGAGGGIFNNGTLVVNPTDDVSGNTPDECVGSGCPV